MTSSPHPGPASSISRCYQVAISSVGALDGCDGLFYVLVLASNFGMRVADMDGRKKWTWMGPG